jgi:hypothetical protein
MIVRNRARQIVEFESVETCMSAFRVDHPEKLLAGQRDVVLTEPPALDRNLAANDCAKPEGERRGRFQE